jgi:hypothetical protein
VTSPPPSDSAPNQRRPSPRTELTFFLALLLTVTLKASYESFFDGLGAFDSLSDAWGHFSQDLAKAWLFVFQFVVYLITLFRFYWGSYRYLRTEPDIERARDLIADFVGLVILFTGLYIAGVTVKTTYLFYSAIAFFHVLDGFWFWIAMLILGGSTAIKTIVLWWVTFDVVTVVAFVVLNILDVLRGPSYWYQGFALVVLLLIGIFDFYKHWDFYTDKQGWQDKWAKKKAAARN